MRMLLIALCLGTALALSGQADEGAIRACFDGYKKAILKDKGEKAVGFLDSSTIAYYGRVLELVRYGDSATVDGLPLIDKINVLTIRHQADPVQVRDVDARELLVYAIDEGLVGKASVERNTLGEVYVDGDSATGQLVADGMPTPLAFGFRKETGTWKFDLTSIFEISNEAIRMLIDGSGESDNVFIFSMLELAGDRRPDAAIWEPFSSRH
jgi:ABC-type transport system substrate-binding protein